MNRADLQHLAEERAREAETLLNAGHWSGTYYVIGYAVECALKACIAKLTNQYDFPDKDVTLKCFTHKIEVLVDVAGLKVLRNADASANRIFDENWKIVKDWNEQARYQQWTEAKARELFTAITDPTNGGLRWIMVHW